MLALQKTAALPGLALTEVPEPPPPGDGEVLLDVAAVGVCGTDLHIDHWTPNYRFMVSALPVTIGHEFAGRVRAVGAGVSTVAPGDLVTVMPSVTCGTCPECVAGRQDRCERRRGIGITRPGAFARGVIVPLRNCIAVPSTVDAELAALCEPLTVGAEAVRVGEVHEGDRILVLGPGTIGQAIAMAAREAGAAEIVIVGRHDGERLATMHALGFTRLVDVGERTLSEALTAAGEGERFDRVFEATGAPAIVDAALGVLRPGGILVISGIHAAPAPIDLTRVVRSTLQIRGAYRASPAQWPVVIARLAARPDAYRPMITHRLPLTDALEGFRIAHARAASKVMVFPG